MAIFSNLFTARAAAFACAAMLATNEAWASVLFSENFSQAQTNDTNQSYGVGLIDNTGFFVTSEAVKKSIEEQLIHCRGCFNH